MIEHRAWQPPNYDDGFRGSRLAICGFSHFSDEGDDPEMTNIVVERVVSGETRYGFFSAVARAFDSEPADLFRYAIFFNFLPTSVGSGDARFAQGSAEQHEAGRKRVTRIIETHRPDRLFVFSRKAWNSFPPTREEMLGQAAPDGGVYDRKDGGKTVAIALRHPLFAQSEPLRAAVANALNPMKSRSETEKWI